VIDGAPKRIHAVFIADGLGFPDEAAVYLDLETSRSTNVQRFSLGTVGRPQNPEDPHLDASGEFGTFEIKIVDQSQSIGRLLGVARGLRIRAPGGGDSSPDRQSLLPVYPCDLGNEIWRLSFVESRRPWLEVNKHIPGILEQVAHDPTFISLVYPQVLRAIFVRIFYVESYFVEPDKDSGDWKDQWLQWGIDSHPENQVLTEDKKSDEAAITEWIDTVVAEFAQVIGLKAKYTEALASRRKTR